jgi:Tol biopolymer transport system component
MGIMDVESGEERPLQLPGYRIYSPPSWASAGTIVAVASSDDGAAVALFDVTNPDEGKLKEVLWKKGDRLDANPSYPIFSPITRRCVFVGREPKGMALYSVQQGSFGPPKRLEPKGYDHNIAGLEYSPDGRYVLFGSDRPDRLARESAPNAEDSEREDAGPRKTP